jgi:hypothetical protein
MLAKSVHILGSRFRRLPNPCADAWNPGLDVAACLGAFAINIDKCPSLGSHTLTTELQELFQHGRMDALVLANGQTLVQKIKAYSVATTHLVESEKADSLYYPEEERQAMKDQAAQNYNIRLLDLLDSLHWAIERVDERLKDLVDNPQFDKVVALHFGAVLDQQLALNVELANATGDSPKERILIDFYFNNIYLAAVTGSAEKASGEQTPDSATTHSTTGSDEVTLSPTVTEERSAIWLGLMFRMWSWLFLHDFNPEDRMIERSEFKDNRLPVYIG